MAYLEKGPRVGRTQGATIFWGIVSVFFAAAACFYFWKNQENETSANVLRDQVLALQEQRENLNSQKEKLQAGISETEKQLKTREDFLQEKETKLAAEESRLEAMGQQSQNQVLQNQAQAAVVKKFNETVRKVTKDTDMDVVLRGGRPVLRVPNSILFGMGDAVLKPDGKALLAQIAQSLNGQLDTFELRVESFTDEGEIANAPDASPSPTPTPKPDEKSKPDDTGKNAPAPKVHYSNTWDLTSARAAVIARFFRSQTSLPFQSILVIGRSDFNPIVPAGKEGHARNRRIEITVTPMPISFHSAEVAHSAADKGSKTPTPAPTPTPDPLAPPPEPPAPDKK